jgi:hypothetical protein
VIPFSYIFFGILGATLIPAYLGLYLVSNLRSVRLRYIAAAGVGLTFWFFFDTMGDAVALDENYSVYPPSLFGGLSHFALVGAFAAGVATLAVLDFVAVRHLRGGRAESSGGGFGGARYLFLIPAAIALVMGIHGLGEGWDASSAVSSATSGNSSFLGAMIQAFGSVPAVASYPIHKFLEASIIAAAYAAYVSMSGGATKARWWHIPLLGLLFGGPSVVGASIGYFVSFDTSYFFAFGVTAALYATLRLVEATREDFKVGVNAPSFLGGKVFVALAVGFYLLYTAALLH